MPFSAFPIRTAAALCVCLLTAAAPAKAGICFPASSDVVSLGEAAARAYATRSLDAKIEETKQLIAARGETVGRIAGRQIDCEPYANILGADEWQCRGKARVCAAN